MHPAGHRIEIYPEQTFMRLTLWGDWANAQTDGLAVDHAKAVLEMKAAGVPHGHFLTLVDMRQKLLTEEVTVAEFKKSFEANSPSRRTAIIVSPPLPTSMAERIAPPGRVLIAYTEEEALSWLFQQA
jgi:hypothetical protein